MSATSRSAGGARTETNAGAGAPGAFVTPAGAGAPGAWQCAETIEARREAYFGPSLYNSVYVYTCVHLYIYVYNVHKYYH